MMIDPDGNANGSWPDLVPPGKNSPVRHWIVGNIPGDKGLNIVADPNSPLVGLVSSKGVYDQWVSYFKLSGEMETKPWATSGQ